MRTHSGEKLFLAAALLSLLALAFTASSQAPRLGAADKLAVSRAEGLFRAGEESGELMVEATFRFLTTTAAGQQGRLTLLVDLAPLASFAAPNGAKPGGPATGMPAAGGFKVSLVADNRDGDTWIAHQYVEAPAAAGAPFWSYEAVLELPAELRDLAVIVEEPASGMWGGAVAEPTDEELDAPRAAALSIASGVWSVLETGSGAGEAVAQAPPAISTPPIAATPPAPGMPPPAAPPVAGPTPAVPPAAAPLAEPSAAPGSVIRLLPPRGRRPAKGTVFDTLVADYEVAKVEFYLDGKKVATATKEPFDARLDLAGPGTGQTVKVVALAGDGRELGSDALVVNDPARTLRVRLTKVEGDPASGSLDVEAQVAVPSTVRLQRVELYWNETLAARLTAPPFAAKIPTGGRPGEADYVRAVAYAADGTSVEDVRLMSSRGVAEAVEVTLVQLYAVVTDGAGKPVRDLGRDDFSLKLGSRAQEVANVSFATDVPLLLGLVVDTSGSMEHIMNETKQAAAQFLDATIQDADQAFLVDFSTKPRLRQRATGDVMELVSSFRGMRADGFTALFDSVIFSLLEFSRGSSRRALVLLSDGDDYGSRFGSRRCVQYSQRMGVPVYVIVLGGERVIRGTGRLDLEAVTGESGGRLYFAETMQDLAGSYAEINDELRSQYLVTFYAPAGVSPEALRDVEVKVKRKGLEVRSVVGVE